MTYYTSAQDTIITKARAKQECTDHGIAFSDLVLELGNHDKYVAIDILEWLGY